MSVYDSSGALAKGMKTLMLRWLDTKADWNDAVARAFEKEVLEPLEGDLKNAMGAMDTMNTLLLQIRKDCE